MTFNAPSNPVLVAPRPVRLATVFSNTFPRSPTHIRLVTAPPQQTESTTPKERVLFSDLNENAQEEKPVELVDKEISSPSPRSTLSSEALEEFLSILRPALLSPCASPVSRTRSRAARRSGGPAFAIPASYRPRILLSRGPAPDENSGDTTAVARSPNGMQAPLPELAGEDEGDMFLLSRWQVSHALSSPVSRMHTRNPFQRYATSEVPGTPTPCSPASVPLPAPTPGELLEAY
ncbi:hypothetical protein CONPUDRAFT_162619 [Coniophora puteana RWD-64-598 SS2]|uniref:Uncharacterized protein n=1 Tax=Coniophora puteana (strain RWD-64-598) TaxID=741705 RepID=A0A5M3N210_CONPW|nr:uncharacterized protein CONPUDRAFT_162619 [Coniophora puteana RWD-64-598 SS2]EIW85419.1 hypothetical protein CONPUDRAFT_162619 [Coniophora puteana RWD-64-598 SS2]